MIPMHPRLKLWMELGGLLAEAAEGGAKQVKKSLTRRRKGTFRTRRPGVDTPLWNACAALLRDELKPRGSKVRLARYLDIPKQRLSDFLKNGSRMPEAETLLQILNWLAQKQAGRDISL